MILMDVGNAGRRPLERELALIDPAPLRLQRRRHPLLDGAHRLEILVETDLVASAPLAPYFLRVVEHEIEHARVITLQSRNHGRIVRVQAGNYRRAVAAEEPVEGELRNDLFRDGR